MPRPSFGFAPRHVFFRADWVGVEPAFPRMNEAWSRTALAAGACGRYGRHMGVIADFIIATEPEALEYSRSQTGIPPADCLEAKGITLVELSTLLALLDGREWQDHLLDLFAPVGEEENMLTRMPDQLLGRLTDFDYDLEQVAADWAATDEMQWEPDEARGLIDALAQHAARATRAGKSMYLWNCV
jgi:hypothetical protein